MKSLNQSQNKWIIWSGITFSIVIGYQNCAQNFSVLEPDLSKKAGISSSTPTGGTTSGGADDGFGSSGSDSAGSGSVTVIPPVIVPDNMTSDPGASSAVALKLFTADASTLPAAFQASGSASATGSTAPVTPNFDFVTDANENLYVRVTQTPIPHNSVADNAAGCRSPEFNCMINMAIPAPGPLGSILVSTAWVKGAAGTPGVESYQLVASLKGLAPGEILTLPRKARIPVEALSYFQYGTVKTKEILIDSLQLTTSPSGSELTMAAEFCERGVEYVPAVAGTCPNGCGNYSNEGYGAIGGTPESYRLSSQANCPKGIIRIAASSGNLISGPLGGAQTACNEALTASNAVRCLEGRRAMVPSRMSTTYLCGHQNYLVKESYVVPRGDAYMDAFSAPPLEVEFAKNESGALDVVALNYPEGGSDLGAWTCGNWTYSPRKVLCTLNDKLSCQYSRAGFGTYPPALNLRFNVDVNTQGVRIGSDCPSGTNAACWKAYRSEGFSR